MSVVLPLHQPVVVVVRFLHADGAVRYSLPLALAPVLDELPFPDHERAALALVPAALRCDDAEVPDPGDERAEHVQALGLFVLGGVGAQEVIKLVTGQFEPEAHTLVYDAAKAVTAAVL